MSIGPAQFECARSFDDLLSSSPADGQGGSVRPGRCVGAPEPADVGEPSNPVSRGGREWSRPASALFTSDSTRSLTGSHPVPITYRLVDSDGELLASGDTIGYLKGFVGDLEAGRYAVDEIRDEPAPSGHTSRRCGVILELEYGSIVTEPDPWEA
jgi:hypothetical protein